MNCLLSDPKKLGFFKLSAICWKSSLHHRFEVINRVTLTPWKLNGVYFDGRILNVSTVESAVIESINGTVL